MIELADAYDDNLVIKQAWKRWKEKAKSTLEWLKAVERSDQYSKKIQKRKSMGDMRSIVNAKKRRESFENGDDDMRSERSVGSASTGRRVRPRLSHKYEKPRTDEELAKRLREVCYSVDTFTAI